MEFTRKKIIMIGGLSIGIFALIVVILIWVIPQPSPPAHLKIWGLYDEASAYATIISDFTKQNKNVVIQYEQKDPATYEEDLIRAYAEDKAPDIWMMQNTWLPKYKNIIVALPKSLNSTLPFSTFKSTFVDAVESDFSENEKIYGLPLYMDSLAMFYNKDYFNSAGISASPETWDDLIADIPLLVKKDQWGNIQRAGAAIGTADNINRCTDILWLLMMQNGAIMMNEAKTVATFNESARKQDGTSFYPGRDALEFYTSFANPSKKVYTWNNELRYSIDAFIEGKTAILFNYSHQIATIKARAPYLNFGIAPMPQLKSRNHDVNYANYWGFVVSKKSKYSEPAWNFLIFLTQNSSAKKYLQTTQKPTARRDLVDWQRNDLELGVFAKQALSAKSWYQIDNAKIETIFSDAINSVILGSAAINKAMDTAASQVNLLMKGQ